MPYTEAGVVMVVPVIDNRRKNAWAFLEPWTWDLWLTTSCFFIFIGFCGCARERVGSNLARFVMSMWIFVVLILTINYTASLASLYTVQQLQPSVTDIKDLVRKEENIGYLNNSYVYDI
ncbi:unnamed protein product [Prunus armeniaca]|uniref:Ionotropic glutamate receptor C-terminal domain-containing protein n=1 Tax=Prunus armeniaca TaxID=36596 RepID=A0A6J5TPG4_PRUAR|nr:unnamed protein product [Prunus armeniaca]